MKKISVLSFSLSILSFTAFVVSAQDTVSKSVLPSTTLEKKATDNVPTTVEKIDSDMAEALSIIDDKYVDNKRINYNELFKSSIEGMLHSLDPHSNYFDAKENEQFRTDQNSQYFGIGASIGDLRDPQGKILGTYIKSTFENAPANRAGLRYGDKIVEVNGVSMIGKPFNEVRTFLRGPRGTEAKIVVEKHGSGKRELVEIIRDAVPQPSVPESYMLGSNIGYIAMTGGFNHTTYAEFDEALKNLKRQGMTQLILDLRSNGGGLVMQAFQVANRFLAEGQTVLTQKGRIEGAADSLIVDNPNPEKMPLIVMVNQGSASASEILTGALQDHDRALIVGETSFGKGLVQNPFQLDYGSMVLLTIAKYETPSGRLIQRDYSKGNLYDYYNKADGVNTRSEEFKTDLGRTVYGGGGITPDVIVKNPTLTQTEIKSETKLLDPLFGFALDLSFGKIPGFEAYKIDRPIKFGYVLKNTDFQISEELLAAFKKYAEEKYNIQPNLIDREKKFVVRNLRTELTTAAYGINTSLQVFTEYDKQLQKAIEVMPQAVELSHGVKPK